VRGNEDRKGVVQEPSCRLLRKGSLSGSPPDDKVSDYDSQEQGKKGYANRPDMVLQEKRGTLTVEDSQDAPHEIANASPHENESQKLGKGQLKDSRRKHENLEGCRGRQD